MSEDDPLGNGCKPTDRRVTPPHVLDAVRAYTGGPIWLDPCTEPDNPTGAVWAFCRDGLVAEWVDMLVGVNPASKPIAPPRRVGWLNPPFSNRAPWDTRAVAVSECGGTFLVFGNLEASKNVDRLNEAATARCDLYTRPKCVDPATGKKMDVGRLGSVWLLGGELERFARSFRSIGYIIPMAIVRMMSEERGIE